MFLSKSFGYALRGILYVAAAHDDGRKVQIDEIAGKLSVPRHFLGKIMQQMVKNDLLRSTKGPYGGFTLTEETLNSPLVRLVQITDGMDQFNYCVLKLKYCDRVNPCPLHHDMEEIRTELLNVFHETTIGDLVNGNKNSLIRSLAIDSGFSH